MTGGGGGTSRSARTDEDPTEHADDGTPQSVNSIRVLPRMFGFT